MTDHADRVHTSLLVLRCQTGDHAAFEELVRRYQTGVRFYLQKMVGETPSAEDLFQEVWLDVFKGIAKLHDPQAFPAWLYQIARHRAFRVLKQRSSPQRIEEVHIPEKSAPPEEFAAEDAEHVHAALGHLKPDQREILLLRFLEEMSYDEIARVVGCPVGTVRSRIHYAKVALRQVIERMDEHE